MAKETIKIYLEGSDKRALLAKASEMGFEGRGALSHFLSYLSKNEILFLDPNCKKMLKALNLS